MADSGSHHQVQIVGLHAQLAGSRLLGDLPWSKRGARGDLVYEVQTSAQRAADLWVSLEDLCLVGQRISVVIRPRLSRTQVRAAKTRLARRLRDRTPGFLSQGVRLDTQGRYSLTPEAVALHMARHNPHRKVLDVGCGVGGNTIAFARVGAMVQAWELDPTRADMARHNCRVYGVSSKVQVLEKDALAELPSRFDGLVFCDPPWGIDHKNQPSTLTRYPLAQALWNQRGGYAALWLKLPPGFDPNTVPKAPGEPPFSVRMYYGEASGDWHTPKFLLLRYPAQGADVAS